MSPYISVIKSTDIDPEMFDEREKSLIDLIRHDITYAEMEPIFGFTKRTIMNWAKRIALELMSLSSDSIGLRGSQE